MVPTLGPAAALRAAIEAAPDHDPTGAAPEFSADGGVTVFGAAGRSARLQPLGRRTRVSLADRDRLVAEAEVDHAALLVGIDAGHGGYHAAAGALREQNGPRHRP